MQTGCSLHRLYDIEVPQHINLNTIDEVPQHIIPNTIDIDIFMRFNTRKLASKIWLQL